MTALWYEYECEYSQWRSPQLFDSLPHQNCNKKPAARKRWTRDFHRIRLEVQRTKTPLNAGVRFPDAKKSPINVDRPPIKFDQRRPTNRLVAIKPVRTWSVG
jgi:hypothetical protein